MICSNFSWLLELIAALVLGGLLSHYIYFRTVKAKFWEKRNVPHLPAVYWGNLITVGITRSAKDFFQEIYRNHKEKRILGMWLAQSPVLTVFDREIIKNILARDFSNFHDRFNFGYGDHDPLNKYNLLNLNGNAWRNLRIKLTPAFSTGKMKMMFPTLMKCGDELREFLEESAQSGATFDAKDVAGRYLITCIGTCAFGIETNAMKDPHSEFFYWCNQIFHLKTKDYIVFLLTVMFPSLGEIFKVTFIPKGTTEFFMKTVTETVKYRKENNVIRKDFMQQLIELIERDQNEPDNTATAAQDSKDQSVKMTIEVAAAQAFIFFSAGFDSTATTMTMAMYELALNLDIQKKLRDEIKEAAVKEGSSLGYDTIMKMEYLDCVIQETLRKYLVFPLHIRTAEKDYLIPGMDATIPKDTMIIIPAYSLSQDPEYFPEPEKFDPLRFSKERKHEIPPYSDFPFGEGPRNCIGNRFALLQAKIALISILMNFSLVPTQQTPKELEYFINRIALCPSSDLHLRLVPDKE